MAKVEGSQETSASFGIFSELPYELRNMIWTLAFSLFGGTITVHLDNPAINAASYFVWHRVSKADRAVPPLLSVSRESRCLAEKYYQQGFKASRQRRGSRELVLCPHEKVVAIKNEKLWWDPNHDILELRDFHEYNYAGRCPRPVSCQENILGGATIFDTRVSKLSMPYQFWYANGGWAKRWLSQFPGVMEIELTVNGMTEDWYRYLRRTLPEGVQKVGRGLSEKNRLALIHKAEAAIEKTCGPPSNMPWDFLRRVKIVVRDVSELRQ